MLQKQGRSVHTSASRLAPNRGVALIMVIFMIALASAVLISLTESSYVAMRLNGAAEQRVKAEYILKSAVNFAQVLIKADTTTTYDDPVQDAWMQFSEGREVPGEMLGLPEPNIRVSLLISPANGKVPLLCMYQSTQENAPVKEWRDVILRLFTVLGFDQPGTQMNMGTDGAALPNSAQMVANLFDYLDSNKESFPSDDKLPQGFEADLPDGQSLRNEGIIDSLASELAVIPGFSPGRLQRMLPFVSTQRNGCKINVNAAPLEVLQAALDDQSGTEAAKIEQCRDPSRGGTPIQNPSQDLPNCGVIVNQQINFDAQATDFDVIAKVEYGTAMFMATAQLRKGAGPGRLPTITGPQLY